MTSAIFSFFLVLVTSAPQKNKTKLALIAVINSQDDVIGPYRITIDAKVLKMFGLFS